MCPVEENFNPLKHSLAMKPDHRWTLRASAVNRHPALIMKPPAKTSKRWGQDDDYFDLMILTSLPGFLLLLVSPLNAAVDAHTVASADPGWRQQSFAPAPASSTPLTGDKAIAHLEATGQYESLAAAITGARYAVKPLRTPDGSTTEYTKYSEGGEGSASADSDFRILAPAPCLLTSDSSAFSAPNPAHGLNSTFTPDGLNLHRPQPGAVATNW